MRSEKDVRLRIDMLESQSSSLARILSKAIKERNEAAFAEYSERLASNRGRIEELRWILEERAGQSILDLQIACLKSGETVRQTLERLKSGEISMAHLPSDAQAMVRKGALELQGLNKS